MSYSGKEMDQTIEPEGRKEDPHRQFLRKRNLDNIRRVLFGELTAEQLAEQFADRELELEDRADHDGLTGILNYLGFVDALTEDLKIIHQLDIPAYLAFLDIDRLKEFNDTMGKINGNRLIKTYASVLQSKTEQSTHILSLIGRFGGDEFVWLSIGASKQDVLSLSEEIRRGIPEAVKGEFNDPTLERTVSIGIVQVQKEDDPLTLLDRADQKLKQAKQTRDKVVFEGNLF